MNAEQKQRAEQIVRQWGHTSAGTMSHAWAGRSAVALLQELIDAPEQDAGVPAGWRDAVELAAQMLTWGDNDGGLMQRQLDEMAAHQRRLFAMLAAAPEAPADRRIKVKLGSQYGSDLNGHWFYLHPADEHAEAALAKHTGRAAPEAPAVRPDQSENTLEMVKREIFQAQQALLNEVQQRDKLLAMCEELAGCAEYWSEYDVPVGIVGRLKAAIAEVRGGK